MEKAEATIPSNDPNDPNAPATTESASYTWLADGTKAAVIDQNGNGYVYLGSLIYKRLPDGTLELESTAHGSGRIVVKDDPENPGEKIYEPQYHITDHLGSVRVVVNQSGEVLARNDYYPFGKSHNNPLLTAPTDATQNRYLYNGKEKQLTGNLGMLDYGWRMHDPEIGRWFGVDKLAEKYSSMSPYVFSANNPIRFIDPDGRVWGNAFDEEFARKVADGMKSAMESKMARLTRIENRIAKKESQNKDASSLKETLSNVKQEISTLSEGIDEIAQMGNDQNTTFTFDFSGSAETNFDGEDKSTIKISVVNGERQIASGVHELSHAYDLSKGMDMGSAAQRCDGEIKAYKRQYAYSPVSMPASYYGGLRNISDVNMYWVAGVYDANGVYSYANIVFPRPGGISKKDLESTLDVIRENSKK